MIKQKRFDKAMIKQKRITLSSKPINQAEGLFSYLPSNLQY